MMFSSTPTISTMQEFFKTAVSNTSTSRYNQSRNNSEDDIHRHNHNDSESKLYGDESHATKSHHSLKHPQISTHPNLSTTTTSTASTSSSSSILPGSMNLFLPHHDFKYGSGSAGKKNIHGMSENDIKSVVLNTESFHIIQEQLRVNYRAQSNSVAKQIAIQLIREQHLKQQQLQLRKEQQLRQEQRKLKIARELTEARIKSQQALKLKIKSKHESDSENEDDDGSHDNHQQGDDLYNNKSTNSSSPTSVMSTCVSIPDDVIAADDTLITAPLMSMNDDDSEDGDIQEVME